MNEMIERVAKAIALSHEGRNWDTMMEHGREWWRKSARAAIEAMREARLVAEHMDGTVSLLAEVDMLDGSIRVERDDDVFRMGTLSAIVVPAPTQVGAA